MQSFRQKLLVLSILSGLAASAWACQVPVFRYALERWTADKYEVVILHDAPLSAEIKAQLEGLQNDHARQISNVEVRLFEASQLRDPRLKELWQQRTDTTRPLMVVLYPRNAMEVPDRLLSAQPLTDSALDELVSSPARREIARRLSAGESAVWLFVASGHAPQDEQALKELSQQILRNQQQLTLPSAEELEIDPQVLASNKLPLKIAFSVIKVERTDPAEKLLVQALDRSEVDLPSSEPMAFPVFGRGRVLYALVGKGIMPATIDAACTFMTGPCSCQVKNQNPGFDLLLSHDWEQAVAGSMISDPIPDEKTEPQLLAIPPGRRK
jgi:hypothetical protein